MSSTTWIALFRGINLGRAKRVAMADLRKLLEELGYGDVKTLLQSGNAVFTADRGSASSIGRTIESSLEAELGVESTVIMRTDSELAAVVRANPFTKGKGKSKADPKELHAVFLSAKPTAKLVAGLDPEAYAPDEFAPGDRVVYLRLPNGVAGSRLPALDKPLGVAATMRTWRTVTRLSELASG